MSRDRVRRVFGTVAASAAAMLAAFLIAACGGTAPAPATPQPAVAPTKAVEPAKAPAATAGPTRAAEPTKAAAPQPTAAPAKQADYPEKGKTITYILPYAAGAAADANARVLASLMEKELGVPVQVVNRDGAGSQVGMTELARAKPDGYTIGQPTLPSFNTTYMDPARQAIYTRDSFRPVAGMVVDPYMVAVKSDSPYKTSKELLDAAKSKPEKIIMAVGAGKLSALHLAVLLLEKAAGVKFATVLFDSAGPAVTQLLGGHVDAAAQSGGAFAEMAKPGGQLRVLGIMDKRESKFFPEVKTMEAQGYNISFGAYQVLTAPAGTPQQIVDILSGAVKKVMETDEFKMRMETRGVPVQYRTSAEVAALWTELDSQVKPVLEEAMKPQ